MTLLFEKRMMINPQMSLLKNIVFMPHHDGLFVDRVDDCLDEEIHRGTEDQFDNREDNQLKENGGAEVDIILSQPNCGF